MTAIPRTSRTRLVAGLIVTGLAAALCAPAWAQGGPRGYGQGRGTTSAVQPLTAEEAAELAHMREEEKLARDVYHYLFTQWNVVAFDNIARSEQRHFDAIGRLIERYGVTDPALNNPAGVFTNETLGELYSQLIAKGTISLTDALEVGVAIEELDIKDLEEALTVATKTDAKRVYANLLQGSLSHLETFEGYLQVLTETQ